MRIKYFLQPSVKNHSENEELGSKYHHPFDLQKELCLVYGALGVKSRFDCDFVHDCENFWLYIRANIPFSMPMRNGLAVMFEVPFLDTSYPVHSNTYYAGL